MSSPLGRSHRTTLYRTLTGPADSAFCHRVSEALAKGWALYGSPNVAFDSKQGVMICMQAVTKDIDGLDYSPDLKLGDQ